MIEKLNTAVINPDRFTPSKTKAADAHLVKDSVRLSSAAVNIKPAEKPEPPFETPKSAIDKLVKGFGYAEFPQVSPDGEKVVFNVVHDYYTSQMLEMDADGKNVRSLFTKEPLDKDNVHDFLAKNQGKIDEQGTWAKDGKSIYYRTNRNGTFDIGRYDTKTGKTEVAVKNEKLNLKHPVEADDGSILFYGGEPGDVHKTTDKFSNLFKTNGQKGGYKQLTYTNGEFAYKHPSAGPDGIILAHKEMKHLPDENSDLISFDPKTGREVNLTNTPDADEKHPFYNEAAGLITFHSDETGDKNLWISAPDTKRRVQLTFYGKSAQSPCWSPDGKKIYFVKKKTRQPEGEPFYKRQADIRVIDVKTALTELKDQAAGLLKKAKDSGDRNKIKKAQKDYNDYSFFLKKYE